MCHIRVLKESREKRKSDCVIPKGSGKNNAGKLQIFRFVAQHLGPSHEDRFLCFLELFGLFLGG